MVPKLPTDIIGLLNTYKRTIRELRGIIVM